jgi:hypothetical protein
MNDTLTSAGNLAINLSNLGEHQIKMSPTGACPD